MARRTQKDYAYVIDDMIDHYRKTRHTDRMPGKRLLLPVVELIFKDQRHIGRGYFKDTFWISSLSGKKDLVLKIGRPESIRMDWDIYMAAKRSGLADRHFAKCYWKTKYCILQKFGEQKKVPDDKLAQLRRKAYRAGLVDIKRDNIRYAGGTYRIVDANFKGPAPRLHNMKKGKQKH